jgi:hypothetical protein
LKDNLQKKMAMSAKAKWMAGIIADVFKIGEYDA